MDLTHRADGASNEMLVRSELQERFLAASKRNLLFGTLMVAGIAAFLWSDANHAGLIIWVVLVAVTLLPAVVMQVTEPSFDVFYRSSLVLEVFSGLAWASASVIAMPRTIVAQSILLMLLIGVLMSGASNISHFLGIFAAFHLPLATLVCIGFVRNGNWPVAPFVTFWVLGFVYVTASAYEARETQSALVRANLDLGSANQLLEVQARTDKLTGLANRFEFTDSLEDRIAERQAVATGATALQPVTLAYMDIDDFKQINDDFGHHAGDELLRQAADRLVAAATEPELVARLGGDELTILSAADAHALGTKVLSCFGEPFVIDGRSMSVRCSVGIASAQQTTTGEELMRNADTALYAAKKAGGGRHRVFGRSLQLHSERRLTLESDLHGALANGEIVPWVQPIVDLDTGRIVAAEALARWERPDGVRAAADFIEPIRELGLLGELTKRMVESIDEFQNSILATNARLVPVTINVPCSHLRQVAHHRTSYPVIVEITEETAIDDIDATRRLLQAARSTGHQVWLDDFGIGSSSMLIAARLPINGLKIKREFTAALGTSDAMNGVIAAMVELAARLSLDLVAEGIERESQLPLLREFGITKAQGHFWSPAVPLRDFETWLRTGHRFAVQRHTQQSTAR